VRCGRSAGAGVVEGGEYGEYGEYTVGKRPFLPKASRNIRFETMANHNIFYI
jgi:hypothetical protein